MKYVMDGPNHKMYIISNEDNPTAYFSEIGKYMMQLKIKARHAVFIADTFIYGAFGDGVFNIDDLVKNIQEDQQNQLKVNKQNKISIKDGKKTITVTDVMTMSILGKFNKQKAIKWFKDLEYIQF